MGQTISFAPSGTYKYRMLLELIYMFFINRCHHSLVLLKPGILYSGVTHYGHSAREMKILGTSNQAEIARQTYPNVNFAIICP